MVAEMVPERELQPVAFSIMPLVWSIGSVFGPAFGGFFANPAKRFPALFGGHSFWEKYPFALPNFLAAIVFLFSMTIATLFLKETLEHRRHHEDWGLKLGKRLSRAIKGRRQRRASFVDGEATAPLVPAHHHKHGPAHVGKFRPGMKEVFTTQSSIGLLCYTFLALHSVAYDQVLPVFLNYPPVEYTPENTRLPFFFTGGFGIESNTIGTIFTVYGVACGFIQFVIFPPLCKKFGALRCFRACCEYSSPFHLAFFFFPPKTNV